MSYAIKEIFYTLQGEGARAGRPAVFCRFAGCNLWSGREADRAEAVCNFCDTDFVGIDGTDGGRYETAIELSAKIASKWPPGNSEHRYVVCTGGEPLLQLDPALVDELHRLNFEIAVETNGTLMPPDGIDWICVSPKAKAPQILKQGNELKIVYPQGGIDPADFEAQSFEQFFLSPMDDANVQKNTKEAIAYCLENPRWRLSLQTHKIIGIR